MSNIYTEFTGMDINEEMVLLLWDTCCVTTSVGGYGVLLGYLMPNSTSIGCR